MKGFFKLEVAFIVFVSSASFACFDTFLFLQRSSMVYPEKTLAIETLGEYSFNSIKSGNEDTYLTCFNIYYGFSKRFSFQAGIGSDEKARGEFKIDSFKGRGVYNIVKVSRAGYSLDGILECIGNSSNNDVNFELSFPSIFAKRDYVYVIHPVLSFTFGEARVFQPGWHCGAFRVFDNGSLIGIGTEFMSAQSGSYRARLVDGEYAASLFYGAKIGKNIYIQNEVAKGLSNSRDLGFALTIKFVMGSK